MCGQRLSTANTEPFSASRQIVCPSSATTRRPASRSSSSEAARRLQPCLDNGHEHKPRTSTMV